MQQLTSLFAFVIAAVPLVLAGCGDNTETNSSSSSSSGQGGSGASGGSAVTTGGAGGTGGSGASGGAGGAGAGGSGGGSSLGLGGHTYAVQQLFMGDTDRNGVPSVNAWRQFGLDIDGLSSVATDTNLCQPQGNAPPANVYPDGDNGIDNSFGKLLIPMISGLSSDFSGTINATIASGQWSYLLWADGLGTMPDQSNVPVRAFNAAPLGQPPAFNTTDPWLLTDASLAMPPDPSSALTSWPSSALSNHLLSTSPPAELTINLELSGVPFPLHIQQARITTELSPDRTTASLGVIGGVIDSEELVEVFRQIAGSFDPNLCSGPTFEGFAAQVRQASDILLDGSQDPTQGCNAISIGLGFEAVEANIADVAQPVPPPLLPCP